MRLMHGIRPTVAVALRVNGARHELEVDPERTLLSVLRDELGLTGAKYGCGEGQCGACTVLLDDAAVRSCTLPVARAADREIRTIEGLADGDRLHPVQRAFLEEGALQCGYCTPGMILGAVALLQRTEAPDVAAINAGLQGHLCRCGVYPRIVRAVQRAATAKPQGGGK
jgi:aerobic-type carbon monoxide dehydrogenase small subunit (CoxS/CutS family)